MNTNLDEALVLKDDMYLRKGLKMLIELQFIKVSGSWCCTMGAQ